MVVGVDHSLLAPVNVRYANVVDVVADEIAGCLCCRRVRAFVACEVACDAAPSLWGVSGALR
eukprot:5669699-Pleurochrysis_carterae.AAC.1